MESNWVDVAVRKEPVSESERKGCPRQHRKQSAALHPQVQSGANESYDDSISDDRLAHLSHYYAPANLAGRSTGPWEVWQANQTHFYGLCLLWMNGDQNESNDAFNQAAFVYSL